MREKRIFKKRKKEEQVEKKETDTVKTSKRKLERQTNRE